MWQIEPASELLYISPVVQYFSFYTTGVSCQKAALPDMSWYLSQGIIFLNYKDLMVFDNKKGIEWKSLLSPIHHPLEAAGSLQAQLFPITY